MKSKLILTMCAMVMGGASSASAVLFEVGAGKPFTTIQDAVNAAAALDDPAAVSNTGQSDPVNIVVFPGTYNETVSVPADAAGSAFNTENDGWTIRADTRGSVLVRGGISVGLGRDNSVFDGIDVEMVGTGGYSFGQTARSNTVRNAIIYGGKDTAVNFAAVNSNFLFGTNFLDHVTLFNNSFGVLATNTSGYRISNSIVADNDIGLRRLDSVNGWNVSFSDNFNIQNCESPGGVQDCSAIGTGAGNLNWPDGVDPEFQSTNPADSNFLWLADGAPTAGSADTALPADLGGELNMGARPTPEPASLILMGLCGVFVLRKRRRLRL